MSLLDELDPPYTGKQYIRLQLARPLEVRRAFFAIDLNVSLETAAQAAGLVLPIEMTITAPSKVGFKRHIFRRGVPSAIGFVPQEGGQHLVRLAEVGHNQWWGALVVDVQGEQLQL